MFPRLSKENIFLSVAQVTKINAVLITVTMFVHQKTLLANESDLQEKEESKRGYKNHETAILAVVLIYTGMKRERQASV